MVQKIPLREIFAGEAVLVQCRLCGGVGLGFQFAGRLLLCKVCLDQLTKEWARKEK